MSTAATRAGSPFLRALQERVLLSDGATGTVLHDRGVPVDECLERVNFDRPQLLVQLHTEYIEAGADLIQTNTFGANRYRLAAFDLGPSVDAINRRAVEIARLAATGRQVFVAGDVGPLGVQVAEAEALNAFGEQMKALAEAGADLLILQTFTSLTEAEIAVRAARKVAPALPVIAEISFLASGKTSEGKTPLEAAIALRDAGADLVGANCGEGPPAVLRALREMAKADGVRLIAQPSAGRPLLVQRRVVYAATAEYMAEYARRFVEAGAVVVGGCCGTTPRHIAAMRRSLDAPATRSLAVAPARAPAEPRPPRNSLKEKLAAGRFIVSVEIDPPKGLAVNRTIEAAQRVHDVGADCVNVGDSPMAEVRMSAIAMASLLRERTGLDPIVHCSTRDRNVMALQADLMGAHALGLRNVLCIKGDPHALGSYSTATAVWDVNALGLMRILKGFNAGHDAIDNPVRPATRFFVGAAVNPVAEDIEAEVKLLRRKVTAGADFALSQAVFEVEAVERFLERLKDPPLPIILGIWPIHSARQAAFLNERVIPVPARIAEAIERAGDGGEQRGLELASRLVERVRPLVQGVYFIPSFGRYEGIIELTAAARALAE